MSKILANQIANYGDDSPIELKEGLSIPVGKPLQAAGDGGSSGQVLTSTGLSIQWTTPFDGNYNSLSNRPTIPAAQVQSDWDAVGSIAAILNKPTIPRVPSVVTEAASGGGSLSYSGTTGVFTFSPAEVDTLDTVTGRGASTTNDVSVGKLTVSNDGNSNGQVVIEDLGAYSQIGFHASNGTYQSNIQGVENNIYINTPGLVLMNTYAVFHNGGNVTLNNGQQGTTTFDNGFTVANGTISGIDIEDLDNVDVTGGLSDQQVLKWDSASSSWKPANDLVGGANSIALADLSVNTATAGTAALSYNNTNGVFTFTPPDLSSYLTAETSHDDVLVDGDFTSNGFMKRTGEGTYSIDTNTYLTSETSHDDVLVDGDFASAGFMKTDGAGTYSIDANTYLTTESDPVFTASAASGITTQQIANWDTAHGWGDHGAVGYLTAVSATDLNNISINALSDVDTATVSPQTGEFLRWDGTNWKNQAFSQPVANATISDTAPGGATAGDLWWESDTGRLKIYYNDTDSTQWVDASPPLAQQNAPVAVGYINMNGSSPTWTGTSGYTVAHSGGGGLDEIYTLTFPTAYSARTDYIVHATYDGTDWVYTNGAQVAVARFTDKVVFTVRRWNEDPLNLGDIMVTIINL